jgi:hypothetical protein
MSRKRKKLEKNVHSEEMNALVVDRFLSKISDPHERRLLIEAHGETEEERRSYESDNNLPIGVMDFILMKDDPEVIKMVDDINAKFLANLIDTSGSASKMIELKEMVMAELMTELTRRYPMAVKFLMRYQELFTIEQEGLEYLTKELLIPTQAANNVSAGVNVFATVNAAYAVNLVAAVNVLVGANAATTADVAVKVAAAVVAVTKVGVHDVLE